VIRIWAITANTFREAIRDKVLYTLLFFAFALIGAALLLADLTIGEYDKVLKDIGLASINIFGMLIAIFLGIGLVYKEIERKTIYTIASKPVRRWEFLVGKYLGLVATLALEVGLMSLAFFLVLTYSGTPLGAGLGPAIWLTFVELLVVTAIAILFSSFTTPVLAAMFTLSGALVGRLSAALKEFADQGDRFGESFQLFVDLLYRAWPDLQTFNIRTAAAYGKAVDWEYVAYSTGYGLAWSAALLAAAALIFQHRDFK
jgi:ABC-type transport system involved in multi-copper enzyme maturation permease subunit